MTIDLTLSPIYRIGGQEIHSLPGLLAPPPPPNPARGRERDRLAAYLVLTGTSTFTTSEYMQVAVDAANTFYQTPGAITTALRTAMDHANKTLLERNLITNKTGQFAIGWLTLAAVRETQCTFALSGPMHIYCFSQSEIRHIHEPVTSGKGLGINQSPGIYYSQTPLSAGDRLLFFGRAPDTWNSVLNDLTPGSLDAMRRRLIALSNADLNAVLIQVTDGAGAFHLLNGMPEAAVDKKEETTPPAPTPQLDHPQTAESTPEVEPAAPAAHLVQPSAYSTPPQTAQQDEAPHSSPLSSLPRNTAPRDFPASIPRLQTAPVEAADREIPPPPVVVDVPEEQQPPEAVEQIVEPPKQPRPRTRRERPEWTRQVAKALATGIQSTRQMSKAIGGRLKIFLPRLLPTVETNAPGVPSDAAMIFMTVLIPLMVVTVLSVVYLRYGRSQQYDTYLAQAKEMQAQAVTLSNPIEQRQAWENVLLSVEVAESHNKTAETASLRQEAEARLDQLLGITRMQFNPVFSSNLGIEISRLTASETDLFLLNAKTGEALRAQPSANGRGFQIDTTFTCKPGDYGNYKVGALVDILTLPLLNSVNATLLGIDAAGNLLYCAPGQVAMAIPLPPPDTNWGRVTAFTLSNGNLYVLDAPARAVWVYNGKDGTFIDRPYFFFGGQTPEKQDVIDLIVSGDDLYMLHADGHLSTCSYSRIETKPTRCQDPTPLINPFAAYQASELFASAHFTQMLFTALPDQSILLLDADAQSVLRFAPRTLELQNQFRPTTGAANPVSPGSAGAVAVGPNHVLYLAVDGQAYFATNMP